MTYIKRDWDNTSNEVTKEDFKRIEDGIKSNDTAITEQQEQINDLFINCGTFRTFQNGYTGSARAYKIGRLAFVSIYATKANFSEWEIICTLPTEIRPSSNRITTPVGGGLGTYNNGVCFYAKTNGDLSLTSLPATITEISGIAIFEL